MNKRVKILYISHLHPPKHAPLDSIGGMQRVSMQLVEELEKRNDIEVKKIIQHSPWKGIELKTVFFLIGLKFRLPKIVKEYQADVILFSSMVTAILAPFVRRKIRIPMVTINHGKDVLHPISVYQKLVPKMFKALDGIISVSAATREESILRGMHPEKGIALPNGFDMSDFDRVPDKHHAKQEISKAFSCNLESKKLLLTVGRQVKRKGHEWFIKEVLPNIASDVVYLVIGEGPEHEKLQKIVTQSLFKEKVILVGKQPDDILKHAYSAADIFVMPNIPVPGDMEGFGIVLLEANLAATPAVASNLEGIKDVIVDGTNGYKVPALEPVLFANRIDEILSNGHEELGLKSRAYVEQNFAWNKVAEDYISYLQNVILKQKEQIGLN